MTIPNTYFETAHNPYAEWQTRYPQRRALGYLCTYVPEEIIHAAGLTPIRIMPGTAPAARADAHLQSYTCSLARSCLDQALAGKLDFLAGVAFAHTCDTMQGMSDIWQRAFPNTFVDTVVSPVVLDGPHARKYLIAELRRFAAALEQRFSVRITNDALAASIRLYNTRRTRLAEFYARRDAYSTAEWLAVMNSALVTPPEEFLVPVLPPSLQGPARSGSRLALIGSTMDEPTLAQIVDDLGARVVADDLCNGGRYLDTLVSEQGDPFEALAGRMLARQTCPCKHRSLETRATQLLQLVQRERVQGVIFYLKKFCDPHAWDYVPLAQALDKAQVPHLLLETEQTAPAGQTRVRVEAFLEMIEGI